MKKIIIACVILITIGTIIPSVTAGAAVTKNTSISTANEKAVTPQPLTCSGSNITVQIKVYSWGYFSADITNIGEEKITDITCEMKLTGDISVHGRGTYTNNIGTIEPGQTTNIRYNKPVGGIGDAVFQVQVESPDLSDPVSDQSNGFIFLIFYLGFK